MRKKIVSILFISAVAVWAQQRGPVQPSHMQAATPVVLPPALQGVGIDQKLNDQVPLNLVFKDEYGRSAPLATYFGSKPVVLALVYYQCPMLCTQILNGLTSSLKEVSFDPGKDFQVLAVSFDPQDTPQLAMQKRENYLRRYDRAGTANGWHFLTGDEQNIKALTSAVGFRYKYDAVNKQYIHASGIMILTPHGRLSRYFYGVDYAPRDIRLGLVEASADQIGSPVDQVLLFCYHYDPATGKYGAVTMNILRLFGGAFVLVCGTILLIWWRRDVRADRKVVRQVS